VEFSVPPGKYKNSDLTQTTTVTSDIISHSPFPIIRCSIICVVEKASLNDKIGKSSEVQVKLEDVIEDHILSNMRAYPKVYGLAVWSEDCKWYSYLPLDAVVSLFCESV
jgi:hypothetical protein